MPSLQELMMGMLSKGAQQGSDAVMAGQKQQSDLASMLQGKQADRANTAAQISATHAADLDSQAQTIARLHDEEARQGKMHPGEKLNINFGKESAAISHAEQAMKPGLSLTPAQLEDEKDTAKKISAWDTGGRESAKNNIDTSQGVLQELSDPASPNRRDGWDRNVGGALKNWPSLQGMFAPTEKARADKVQNAAAQLAKDSGVQIRNLQEFNAIVQRAYDPAGTDAQNIDRVKTTIAKLKASQDSMNATSQRYHQTGYATVGEAPSATPQAPQAPGGRTVVGQQRNKKTGEVRNVYSDGTTD